MTDRQADRSDLRARAPTHPAQAPGRGPAASEADGHPIWTHRYTILALTAVVAAALMAWAWAMRGSGIDGTPGALIALAGSVLVALGALVTGRATSDGWRLVLHALLLLGAALTALAGWFLMQWAFTILMGAAVAMTALAAFWPRPETRPAPHERAHPGRRTLP